MRASSFLRRMLSPVWRRMLLSIAPPDTVRWRLELQAADEPCFAIVMALGSGAPAFVPGGLPALLEVFSMTARYDMDEIHSVVEEELLARLSMGTCADLLEGSAACRSGRLQRESVAMALGDFESFSHTPGFLTLRCA